MAEKKSLSTKCRAFLQKIFSKGDKETKKATLLRRIERLERNYIILLKRILEMDGVQFPSKSKSLSEKIMSSPSDETNNGLNEPEPTIH